MGAVDAARSAAARILGRALPSPQAAVYRKYGYVAICWGCGEELEGSAVCPPIRGTAEGQRLDEANEENFRALIASQGWQARAGGTVCPECCRRMLAGEDVTLSDPMGPAAPAKESRYSYGHVKRSLARMYADGAEGGGDDGFQK